ncbi:isopropylmalate isomerase [Sorangium cellulosum]|uniref:3-isopropylmalate dehydratase large subunit n=1 Tax=Sorangium cellulosum TaxID=56 RepID=A0A4P2PSW8_SORCE|nr:3-isopropylmalate dehydratase large subunit [Sorangium cellulosum]AUX19679.1 isopropylmalate isomerase [Sorangium cellulosum]
MGKSLYDKVWDLHKVRTLPNGEDQLFIGLHLIHEVTSPQAFGMLRDLGLRVRMPGRTFATLDHIVPTDNRRRPFKDALAEGMVDALKKACAEQGVTFFDLESGKQGIVHIIGPELGLTQPGMTIACGDSHTSTHGAFGAIAFGIGTTQVRDVLATQTLSLQRLKVRRIEVTGKLGPGVYAKDIILEIIRRLGVSGGTGYAYEYGGSTIEGLSMEERMTLCNMSIEGGARVGYVNPDQTTFEYMKGRQYAPKGEAWDKALEYWRSIASDADARYDDVVRIDASAIAPTVTWGITPGQAISVKERVPAAEEVASESERALVQEALEYMRLEGGKPIEGTKINVAFIGSCTNGRLSDFREVARHLQGRKVAPHVRALAVPGSMEVARAAEAEGLDRVFREAGFEWREPGCSMCLAMNPDKLIGDELCASSSNRNFKGRQGSPTGRTVLMSPVMVAAAAVRGAIADARDVFGI